MSTGTVKWFSDQRGFGFITLDEGEGEDFVHHTAIQAEGFKTLSEGDRVELDVMQGEKGLRAENVRKLADDAATEEPVAEVAEEETTEETEAEAEEAPEAEAEEAPEEEAEEAPEAEVEDASEAEAEAETDVEAEADVGADGDEDRGAGDRAPADGAS